MKAPVGLLSGRAVCVSRWRGFAPKMCIRDRDYVISVGIQQTADLRHLDEAVAKAEAAMRQDRQAYYCLLYTSRCV